MYFLDTNTCIYFLKGKYPIIQQKLLATSPNDIKIPSIVKAELLLGAFKSQHRETNLKKVETFLQPFDVIAFENAMTYVYASIREQTERLGTLVEPNDLFIAAIVKHYDGILVTNNTKEFERINQLNLENWTV